MSSRGLDFPDVVVASRSETFETRRSCVPNSALNLSPPTPNHVWLPKLSSTVPSSLTISFANRYVQYHFAVVSSLSPTRIYFASRLVLKAFFLLVHLVTFDFQFAWHLVHDAPLLLPGRDRQLTEISLAINRRSCFTGYLFGGTFG